MTSDIIEHNVIRKKWRNNTLKIALVCPTEYSAMGGLTIQTLYHLWNSDPSIICERVFMPSRRELAQMYKKMSNYHPDKYSEKKRDSATLFPPLKSIENGMPLNSFDICAFTVSYELDYVNLCWMLRNANIPLTQKERVVDFNNDIVHPLLLAGGPCIRSNPHPIASIMDVVYRGELEPQNEAMFDAIRAAFTYNLEVGEHMSFNDLILQELAKLNGFWVPSFQDEGISKQGLPPRNVFAEDLDMCPHPIDQIFPENPEKVNLPFGNAFYLEVNRGCPFKCNFCMTGWQSKKFRNRSLSELKRIIEELLNHERDFNRKIVMIGSSVMNHPQFEELCQFLIDNELQFSIPSVRVENIIKNPDIAHLLKKGGIKTVAIAPEVGNDEFRKENINKYITNNQILSGCKYLLKAGIPNVKLYLIYGFPNETEEDITSIIDLVREIANLGYGKNAVRLSLNPFIPKSYTPFASFIENYREDNLKMTIFKKRRDMIENAFKGNKQVVVQTLPLEEALFQTIFSIGNNSITPLIIDCYKNYSDFTFSLSKLYDKMIQERESKNEFERKMREGVISFFLQNF